MTAECVDASRLPSSVQEFAPDLVIFDAETQAISRDKPWGALGIKSPPATIVTASDPAALAVFAPMAVDLIVNPLEVERPETASHIARSKIVRTRTETATGDPSSEHSESKPAASS
jgi:AmiR/NasT family two-component response regulator